MKSKYPLSPLAKTSHKQIKAPKMIRRKLKKVKKQNPSRVHKKKSKDLIPASRKNFTRKNKMKTPKMTRRKLKNPKLQKEQN
jgi:hypothetical protein